MPHIDRIEAHSKEYCLARVAECERLAEQAATAENKQIFLELASRWRTLAVEDLRSVSLPSAGMQPPLRSSLP
jgi:hypothetical protein